MYIDVKSDKLRTNLRAYLDHVMSTGDRVLITRHGQEIAALVTPKDLKALEQVENNRDVFLDARHEAQMREFRTMKEVLEEQD